MAASVGVIAAAAAAREKADVLQRFRLSDATAADRAQSLDSLGLRPQGLVARLMAAGVILPGSRANRVYLSEAALAAYEQSTVNRTRWALMAAGAIALGAAGLAFALLFATQAGRR
jgi:hypothetical protein